MDDLALLAIGRSHTILAIELERTIQEVRKAAAREEALRQEITTLKDN